MATATRTRRRTRPADAPAAEASPPDAPAGADLATDAGALPPAAAKKRSTRRSAPARPAARATTPGTAAAAPAEPPATTPATTAGADAAPDTPAAPRTRTPRPTQSTKPAKAAQVAAPAPADPATSVAEAPATTDAPGTRAPAARKTRASAAPAKKAPEKAPKKAVRVATQEVVPETAQGPAQAAAQETTPTAVQPAAPVTAPETAQAAAQEAAPPARPKAPKQAAPRAGRAATRKPGAAAPAAAAGTPAPAALDLVAAVQATLQATPAADERAAPVAASGPRHSAIVLDDDGLRRQLRWQPGRECPPELRQAAAERLDGQGHLRADDDAALPLLLRLAAEARHPLIVDEAVWPHLAADRDARQRLHLLERAYPEGPASPALQSLLRDTALPPFQAEGALFAVVAGRALIADERGLGKRVQALAAATLWRRHFGVQRVLVLCTAGQRAAWQRSWSRLAGATLAVPPQVIEGPLHQRQALWSGAAEVRILSPEALDSDAEHLAHWAPQLLIVDEPQQLSGWSTLQAPHALVLCGAPLAQPMSLLHGIVDWLDLHRQGALQALQRVQTAREQGLALDEAELERLDDGLSRLMLQRLRSEVPEQLPPLVHSERLVPMAPPQREAHERLRQTGARLLEAWQRSGYLSDADQWALSLALHTLGTACHRSDPGDPDSPLAEATVAALQAQLDDWAATGTQHVALVCPQPFDRAPLQARLRFDAGLQWLAPGESPGAEVEVVLQVGVPWRLRRPRRGEAAPAGQQWVYLAAQDSLELGLFDTAAARGDAPRGPAESGARGFLVGQALADWLGACRLAWQATPGPA